MSETTPVPVHARPQDRPIVVVDAASVAPDRRRGGEIRTLLSPRNADTRSGFLGIAVLGEGVQIAEHYHPYSEEFLFVVEGEITADLDGDPVRLRVDEAVVIPPGTRHRLRNTGTGRARAVFQLGPLAPRPDLGHVDTEGAGAAEHAATGRDTR